MGLTRREFVRNAVGAGALLVAGPQIRRAFGHAVDDRIARLGPAEGRFLLHSDLHNHTLLSDGSLRVEEAFAQMRASGLDVAAVTDHAVLGKVAGPVCGHGSCTAFVGINEDRWKQLAAAADGAHVDGDFVALRGFEWTTQTMGHVNVWFSEKWTDGLVMNGLTDFDNVTEIDQIVPQLQGVGDPIQPGLHALPDPASMDLFYDWLGADPKRPLLGGGADAVAGFNHPNLYGNFEAFRYEGSIVDRLVSCEVFNAGEDYFFRGVDEGLTSPIGQCLDAGWRTGLTGVSDEHGTTMGRAELGQAGLWVKEATRAGVREALLARRFFATTVKGLRLDAAANGVSMGGTVVHTTGPLNIAVDLVVPGRAGDSFILQILRPGQPLPAIVHQAPIVAQPAGGSIAQVTVDVDLTDGSWVVLRLCDSALPADTRATGDYATAGAAVAYSSPFFLTAG